MNRLDVYRQTKTEEKPENGDSEFPSLFTRLRDTVGGFTVEEKGKKVLVVRARIPLGKKHGNVELGNIIKIDNPEYYSVLFNHRIDPAYTPVSKRLTFFDIESTGLSGGVGTKAFLVGVLTVDDEEIILTQYFLPNLASESLFLKNIKNALFGSGKIIVSYNGKSYDSNIIKNRMIINRIEIDENEGPHFDLLYTSRRIWRGKLPDFSLQRVESSVLGFKRRYDIPGYLIPDIFSRYLRGYNVLEDLVGVFEHNKNDLLSLFGILIKQVELVAKSIGEEGAKLDKEEDINPVSLSDILVRSNFKGEALKLLDKYMDEPDAVKKKALLLKRDLEYEDSIRYFERLAVVTRKARERIFAYVEISKIYEHSLRNLLKALDYAERAMKVLLMSRYLYPEVKLFDDYCKQSLEKRITRIKRKITRVNGE